MTLSDADVQAAHGKAEKVVDRLVAVTGRDEITELFGELNGFDMAALEHDSDLLLRQFDSMRSAVQQQKQARGQVVAGWSDPSGVAAVGLLDQHWQRADADVAALQSMGKATAAAVEGIRSIRVSRYNAIASITVPSPLMHPLAGGAVGGVAGMALSEAVIDRCAMQAIAVIEQANSEATQGINDILLAVAQGYNDLDTSPYGTERAFPTVAALEESADRSGGGGAASSGAGTQAPGAGTAGQQAGAGTATGAGGGGSAPSAVPASPPPTTPGASAASTEPASSSAGATADGAVERPTPRPFDSATPQRESWFGSEGKGQLPQHDSASDQSPSQTKSPSAGLETAASTTPLQSLGRSIGRIIEQVLALLGVSDLTGQQSTSSDDSPSTTPPSDDGDGISEAPQSDDAAAVRPAAYGENVLDSNEIQVDVDPSGAVRVSLDLGGQQHEVTVHDDGKILLDGRPIALPTEPSEASRSRNVGNLAMMDQ